MKLTGSTWPYHDGSHRRLHPVKEADPVSWFRRRRRDTLLEGRELHAFTPSGAIERWLLRETIRRSAWSIKGTAPLVRPAGGATTTWAWPSRRRTRRTCGGSPPPPQPWL